MMRNTSPVGWIPLLLHKIYYNNSFNAFLISGFVVALPIIGVCIAFDSLYFGELTLTPINFLKANILEGLSRYFGVDPFYRYVFVLLPLFFTVMFPALLVSFFIYRFLTPIIPFCFLMLGYTLSIKMKTWPKFISFMIWLYIIAEAVVYLLLFNSHFRYWEVMRDLQLKE
jgi:phage shock protein PspC (stress-responsive transcriptional regulator)